MRTRAGAPADLSRTPASRCYFRLVFPARLPGGFLVSTPEQAPGLRAACRGRARPPAERLRIQLVRQRPEPAPPDLQRRAQSQQRTAELHPQRQPSGSSTLTNRSASPSRARSRAWVPQAPSLRLHRVDLGEGDTGALRSCRPGTKGYVTMSGVSYQLPAASFQKAESSFSSIASSGSGASSGKSGVLSKLGINRSAGSATPRVVGPARWAAPRPPTSGPPSTWQSAPRPQHLPPEGPPRLGISGTSGLPRSVRSSQQRVASEIKKPQLRPVDEATSDGPCASSRGRPEPPGQARSPPCWAALKTPGSAHAPVRGPHQPRRSPRRPSRRPLHHLLPPS